MSVMAERMERSMWLRLWESFHGRARVTPRAVFDDVDRQIEAMERQLSVLEAEQVLRERERHDG